MSINSPDLQVLVSRVTEVERVNTQQARASQQGAALASQDQKVQQERAQQRVGHVPKVHGTKVDKDGRRNRQDQKHQGRQGEPKTAKNRRGCLDIKI